MSKSGIPCYRNGGCGPYEMRSCYECPASKSDYLQRDVKQKPLTNYDLLIRLSPEELAKLLAIIPNCGKPPTYTIGGICIDDGVRTEKEWLKWLKQEATE